MELYCPVGHSAGIDARGFCVRCGAPAEFVYAAAPDAAVRDLPAHLRTTMWKYGGRLPVARPGDAVSLGEGSTPLVAARDARGGPLLLKDETRNPTGSAKDRAMSVAYTVARERGHGRTILASTGSAGISAAAYAARAGISCTILLPAGTPPMRAAQMAMRGARVLEIAGSFESILPVLEAAVAGGWHHTTTFRRANPFQSEGPKTIAYEIADQLGRPPDVVIVPIGGGGTLAAIGRGFAELGAQSGAGARLPRLIGVQHERYNALEIAMQRGLRTLEEVAGLGLVDTAPVATPNLHHAVPPDAAEALAALRASGGAVVTVSDAEALAGQAQLAAEVGLLAEPSSSVVLPAAAKARERGLIGGDDLCVAILTGSALRDPLPAVGPPIRVTPGEAQAMLT